jgi:hypothetical protein
VAPRHSDFPKGSRRGKCPIETGYLQQTDPFQRRDDHPLFGFATAKSAQQVSSQGHRDRRCRPTALVGTPGAWPNHRRAQGPLPETARAPHDVGDHPRDQTSAEMPSPSTMPLRASGLPPPPQWLTAQPSPWPSRSSDLTWVRCLCSPNWMVSHFDGVAHAAHYGGSVYTREISERA